MTATKPRRGRRPIANPARVKVQVMLTEQELAAVRDHAGLVPLGTLFRELTFRALGIPSRMPTVKR